MADQQTNLHPKNNTTVDLKPNIVSNNIPEKAVTMEKLDQSLQDTISNHSSTIAANTEDIAKNKADIAMNTKVIAKNKADITKNTEDIEKNTNNVNSILDIIDIANNQIKADVLKNSINGDDDVIVDVDVDESNEKLGIHLSPELLNTISTHTSTIATNTEDIAKNKADIVKNTADIAKNTEDITENKADITDNTLIISSLETKTKNLETRTKNLEDTKVIVNTGIFDPTSDNPASQKSIAEEMEKPTLMANIVDSQGNKRFVEGNFPVKNINGITWMYHKWSLSGTHLMIVLAGKNDSDANITFEGNEVFGELQANSLSYIFDKISTVTVYNLVSTAVFRTYKDYTTTEKGNLSLVKPSANHIRIINWNRAVTDIPVGTAFRVQFDLLIDSE